MNLKNDYSIGVVTYINRYHTYFKQNIINLLKYFPDKQIICVINGHPNKLKNIAYLKEITQWLTSLNVQYITFEDHQSLAKCWNWILLMSSAQRNLFLNDDILIKKNFRQDFENHLNNETDFFAINGSFSHFLVNKSLIKKIGWFDERFLGIGEEDGDYLIRMAISKIELKNYHCRDIINFIAPATDPSFQNISIMRGKYSDINRKFMGEKWFFNHLTEEKFEPDIQFSWNNEEYRVKLRDGMDTPEFYDFSLLDNNSNFAPSYKNISNNLSSLKKRIKNFLKK
jgi:hypothetical protein